MVGYGVEVLYVNRSYMDDPLIVKVEGPKFRVLGKHNCLNIHLITIEMKCLYLSGVEIYNCSTKYSLFVAIKIKGSSVHFEYLVLEYVFD